MSQPLKQQSAVRTNIRRDSVCRVGVEPVTFAKLWANYVKGTPYKDAKTGEVPPGFENQCAIRMSATLHKVGVEMKSFTPANVDLKAGGKTIGRILLDGKFAAVRADEMASWLKRQPFCGLPTAPENVSGADWEKKVHGRTGIIFFGDYWARDGETAANLSGGHIDLWNKDTLTPSVESFLRFRAGINSIPNPLDWARGRSGNWYSDLGKARTIFFFEVP